MRVVRTDEGHRLDGEGADVELANRFLTHLGARRFSPLTVRAYAYDLLNFFRFLAERGAALAEVVPTDLFDYLEWQNRPKSSARGAKVVWLSDRRGAAPASMNRRVAAVRGLFAYAVQAGTRAIIRCRRVAAPRGCGLLNVACWAMSVPVVRLLAAAWCVNPSFSPRRSPLTRSPGSWLTWGRIVIGRWRWRCCWVGYEPAR